MPKEDLKVIQTICKGCTTQIEVPVPEHYVRVIKEKCECGMSQDARITRYLMFGVASIMACILGCCTVSHYFTAESVKAVKGAGYKVKERQEILINEPQFTVEPVAAPAQGPPAVEDSQGEKKP